MEEGTKQLFLQIQPGDNVLVALKDLPSGSVIELGGRQILVQEDIPAKHKIFIGDMQIDENVIMYGTVVGKMQMPAAAGSRMTVGNTIHASGRYAYRGPTYQWKPPGTKNFSNRTFQGYKRSDGRAGTANYWLFVPMVFCENRNMDVIKEALTKELGYTSTEKYTRFTRDMIHAYQEGKETDTVQMIQSADKQPARVFENVDGIKFLNHAGGCGGTRQDSAVLSALLAAYADHANVGGVTVLSLGCQHVQVENFLKDLKERNPAFDKPLLIFEQQKIKSEEELITQAIRQTFGGLEQINKLKREPVPLSALNIGVKCGGSDGFSGISANPAVGWAADLLVAEGGKVLLAEFPELCGAEQGILDRCVHAETANKFIHLMEAYDQLAHQAGSGFYMNPSPGNIKDGLITDAIKSTGAARKGGSSPVQDVLDYTEPAKKAGLSLVCTPGNDVEATTGQAASGATLILFTTGLGTPTGNPITPTIKISTNTSLAKRMGDVIDLDAGPIITGEKTIEEVGQEILEYCIKVASGELVPKAVLLGQDDFMPWKRGVSL
jgi:altronate hydrolase